MCVVVALLPSFNLAPCQATAQEVKDASNSDFIVPNRCYTESGVSQAGYSVNYKVGTDSKIVRQKRAPLANCCATLADEAAIKINDG